VNQPRQNVQRGHFVDIFCQSSNVAERHSLTIRYPAPLTKRVLEPPTIIKSHAASQLSVSAYTKA